MPLSFSRPPSNHPSHPHAHYGWQALALAPAETTQQLNLQCAWCSWRLGNADSAKRMYETILDDNPLCWQVGKRWECGGNTVGGVMGQWGGGVWSGGVVGGGAQRTPAIR